MTEKSLVSVIVPCYNSGKTINRTINSVLAQTWQNIELIIVNDGSTDSTTNQILNSLSIQPNIRIYSQSNQGLAAARNNGVKISNGKYVMPLDSDDWLEPNAIEVMLSSCSNHFDGSNIVFSDIRFSGQRYGIKKTYCNPFEQLFSNQLPYCMLIPREALINVKGYDENLSCGLEDWDLNIKLLIKNYNFIKVKEPLFNYRVASSGMFQSITINKFGYIFAQNRKKYSDTYKLWNLAAIYKKSKNSDSNQKLLFYFVLNFVFLIFPLKFFNFAYSSLMKTIRNYNMKIKQNEK